MHDRKIHRHSISLNEEDSSNITVYCQKPHYQEIKQRKEGTGMCLLTAASLKGIPFKRCRLNLIPGVPRSHWGLSCRVTQLKQTLSGAQILTAVSAPHSGHEVTKMFLSLYFDW